MGGKKNSSVGRRENRLFVISVESLRGDSIAGVQIAGIQYNVHNITNKTFKGIDKIVRVFDGFLKDEDACTQGSMDHTVRSSSS